MDKTFFNQLGGNCRAKAINIHGITGCKMNEVAQSLGRAFRVDTAQGGFIFQMNDRCPAGGADLRHLIRLCILCMPGHTDDFRNDIARLTHLNGVANAEAKLFDEILVVQSGAGNGGTGEENRIKTVSLTSGGYLNAMAQRGNLLVEPIKSRCAKLLTLMTAPSISKSSLERFWPICSISAMASSIS